LTLMRTRISTSISMIVTNSPVFRVSLNLMILTLYVKPTLLMKLLLPHLRRLPRSNRRHRTHKSVEVSPRNSTSRCVRTSYMSTSIKFVRHSNVLRSLLLMSCSGHRIIQTIQSPFPAHNVWRRNEPVASDTIFSEVAAICTNGQMMAQILLVVLHLSLIFTE
jgi:hypothetical protein